MKIFTDSLLYQKSENVNEFYLNLARLYCDLKEGKVRSKLVLIENFDYFMQDKFLNKLEFDFLVKNRAERSKLNLKPYEKILVIMNSLICDFGILFIVFSTDKFFKSIYLF